MTPCPYCGRPPAQVSVPTCSHTAATAWCDDCDTSWLIELDTVTDYRL